MVFLCNGGCCPSLLIVVCDDIAGSANNVEMIFRQSKTGVKRFSNGLIANEHCVSARLGDSLFV